MKSKSKFGLVILGFLLSIALVTAQINQCSELIQTAVEAVEEQCDGANRNQVCYGNIALVVEAQPDASNFTFENVGDIEEVAAIRSLQLAGLDEENGVWGVVLMRVQANIPNTLPGQNVIVMLFGDSQIRNAADSVAEQVQAESPQFGPMQAFYFSTGVGQSNCNAVPDDGMLIQTPSGVGSIDLLINEVEVNMGSTIFFTVNEKHEMEVYALEGGVRVTVDGQTQTSVAGTQVHIPLNDEGAADSEPLEIESYADNETLQYLPVAALEREIEIAPALDDEALELLLEYDAVFESINIEDVDELFDYIDSNSQAENFDIANFLINELGYTNFDSELEIYFESELGYDLSSYASYEGTATDSDADGISDDSDNCPSVANPAQTDGNVNGIGDACDTTSSVDSDGDGIADDSDNCPSVANPAQTDGNVNGIGDACDATSSVDSDGDGIADDDDNCPSVANPAQTDSNVNGIGDACDATLTVDSDDDGIADDSDNCPSVANPSQADSNVNGIGDACDTPLPPPNDSDGDGINDDSDNCPSVANPSQADSNANGIGDACDTPPLPPSDSDSDGILDGNDNCPSIANPTQTDTDGDGFGDVCDFSTDIDGDTILDIVDNCPSVPNVTQADSDSDGIGNACDTVVTLPASIDNDGDGVRDVSDVCPNLGSLGFGVADNGCPPNVVEPPDNRINWQYGDLYTVVYTAKNGVDIYCFNGNEWSATRINQMVVNNWDTSLPQSVPVLEVNYANCHWAFYILDDGLYQINIWTHEGKLYEIIADNLRFEGATRRYFDPND